MEGRPEEHHWIEEELGEHSFYSLHNRAIVNRGFSPLHTFDATYNFLKQLHQFPSNKAVETWSYDWYNLNILIPQLVFPDYILTLKTNNFFCQESNDYYAGHQLRMIRVKYAQSLYLWIRIKRIDIVKCLNFTYLHCL